MVCLMDELKEFSASVLKKLRLLHFILSFGIVPNILVESYPPIHDCDVVFLFYLPAS